ncbi:hypothetical protein M514_22687 [Trichuris suis]|uniref:Uncharacterized protein n=1 Tax=Trichuris suis TaxID=68888 RepID=A0A085N6L1_9BILA|nr:hypothetical protein M514_22687 [Trichuris suis]
MEPRAFRNLRPGDLPVTWRSNKGAWMTAAIFKERAGFVRDQEDDVELRPDSPTREAEIEGVDFEDFVAIDDEVATSTEPDPQAVYQSILAEAGMSVEASSAGDDAEEESDDETEMVQKLKQEDVGRMLA